MKAAPILELLVLAFGSSAAALGSVADNAVQQPVGSPSSRTLALSSKPAPNYRQNLLALHQSLIETKSITGTEAAVGSYLVEYLRKRNYRVTTQQAPLRDSTPPGQSRFNVLAWPNDVPGGSRPSSGGPRLLLTSHIDVVPPHIPYGIDTTPDRINSSTIINGRGSVDAKASVAAQVTALEDIRSQLDGESVMLLYVVGEEDQGDGMRTFSDSLQEFAFLDDPNHGSRGFDAVIFGEPTENKLACGHKGILNCVVTARGKAGHSGYPWLGKSANELLIRGLNAVIDADLGSSDLFGNTTVNIGRLDGGVAANVIPASATAQLAIRVATGPQATGQEIVRSRVKRALHEIDADDLVSDCNNGYGVVECNCAVNGFETITVNYGTDVPNLAGNHTKYLYGPGNILVAHSDHEAVTVGDLETAVEGYKKLINHVLWGDSQTMV